MLDNRYTTVYLAFMTSLYVKPAKPPILQPNRFLTALREINQPRSVIVERARAELHALLYVNSFALRPVTLSSGKQSFFYIDCKQTTLTNCGHKNYAEVVYPLIQAFMPTAVGVAGVELGGCPLASAVSYHSNLYSNVLQALYIRKAPKAHGTHTPIEGITGLHTYANRTRDSRPCVLLEDVVTTGASTVRALESMVLTSSPP